MNDTYMNVLRFVTGIAVGIMCMIPFLGKNLYNEIYTKGKNDEGNLVINNIIDYAINCKLDQTGYSFSRDKDKVEFFCSDLKKAYHLTGWHPLESNQ